MNTAERILAIYDKLIQQQGDGPMLKIWADVFEIPRDGPHVEDDITACLVALRAESLEAKLEELTLSPYMRTLVRRQIDTIRLALRVYGIQGARPMHDALRRVVGDFKVEETRIKAEHARATPEAKSIWSSASTIIEKAAKLADQGAKLKKAGEDLGALAGSAYEHVGSMIGTVKPLLLSFIGNP